MRVVINHLTRMRPPMICVAGLTRDGCHIRPLPFEVDLSREHLQTNGGLFAIGAVIELGEVEDVGLPPQCEDRPFALSKATFEFELSAERFWRFQLRTSKPDLREIFGVDLEPVASTMTVPLGKGLASLGCLQTRSRPWLYLDKRGKVRARVNDEDRSLHLPVTDIRLYGEDQETPRTDRIEWLNRAIGPTSLLAVGLGRAYKADWRPVSEHWLQINNIHPASDPMWSKAP